MEIAAPMRIRPGASSPATAAGDSRDRASWTIVLRAPSYSTRDLVCVWPLARTSVIRGRAHRSRRHPGRGIAAPPGEASRQGLWAAFIMAELCGR